MAPARPLPTAAYSIAWIATLPVEVTAALSVLDERHPASPKLHPKDRNTYNLGRIHGHNIVIACLPSGGYGTINAAIVASSIQLSFPSIRFYLLVGVGGGIPTVRDIRLGDVVVSKPEGRCNGVVHYDFGKTTHGGVFEAWGNLNKPPLELLTAITSLQAEGLAGTRSLQRYLSEIYNRIPSLHQDFQYQGSHNDILYSADNAHIVIRGPRNTSTPRIHYGTIASGNRVIKDAITRDRIGRDTGAICFEMEAAGLMDNYGTLVVRGICDYSDSHKNKHWQPYAALVAAVYTKSLLERVEVQNIPIFRQKFRGYADPYTYYEPRDQATYSDSHVPQGSVRGIFDIPGILHPKFSGRKRYLNRIDVAFASSQSPPQGKIVSVYGIPGVGKSQICLKYITDMKDRYTWVFYAIGTTEEQWLNSCNSIIHLLGLPGMEELEQSKRLQKLRTWFSSRDHWFLVIDDVTQGVVDMVRMTFPSCLRGHILLSTRDKFIAEGFSRFEDCIELREMNIAEGRDLVLKIYSSCRSEQRVNEHAEARVLAEHISKELGGLPLALEQGTAFAKRRYWPLSNFLEGLRKNKRSIIECNTETSLHHLDIVTTLSMALNELEPEDIAILNLMLMMRPQALPLSLLLDGAVGIETVSQPNRYLFQTNNARLSTVWGGGNEAIVKDRGTQISTFELIQNALESEASLERVIVRMEKSSLIRRGNKGEIWIHDLIREFLLQMLGEHEYKGLLVCAVKIMSTAFTPICESFKVRKGRLFFPHALEVYKLTEHEESTTIDRMCLINQLACYLENDIRNEEALVLSAELLGLVLTANVNDVEFKNKIIERVLQPYNSKATETGSTICSRRLQQVIEVCENKGCLINHVFEYTILKNIAAMHTNLGQHAEALDLLEYLSTKLDLMDSSKELDFIRYRGLYSAGISHHEQGNHKEALIFYKKAYKGFKKGKRFGYRALQVLHAIGLIYSDQSATNQQNSEKAMGYLTKGLSRVIESYGVNDYMTGCYLQALGILFENMGDYAEAIRYMGKGLLIFERIYGVHHPITKELIQYRNYLLAEELRR